MPLSNEIDELIGGFTNPPEEVPPVEVIEEPVSDPIEEPVIEEPSIKPTVEEPALEEPTPVEPLVAEPVEPLAIDEPTEETTEELLARINTLTNRVEELTVISGGPVAPKEVPAVEPITERPTPVPAVPITLAQGMFDFLGDRSIDDVVDSKESFNKLLNEVYARAASVAQQKANEQILLSIPDLIVGHINRKATIDKMVNDFYSANEDLVSIKKTVGACANDVHAEHPDWELPQVFNEAGIKARKILGMREPVRKQPPVTNSPAFVTPNRAKPPARKVSALQDEIDSILS